MTTPKPPIHPFELNGRLVDLQLFEEICTITWHAPTPDKPDAKFTLGKFPKTKEFMVYASEIMPGQQSPTQAAAAKKYVVYRGTSHAKAQETFQSYF